MSDELRAAAERVLDDPLRDVQSVNDSDLHALVENAQKLADAYLAEHPADDAEPVTEEWWSTPSVSKALDDVCAIGISVMKAEVFGECDTA